VVDHIFLSCGKRVFSREAGLHSLLDRWTVFTTVSQTIGGVALINSLDRICNDRSRLVHAPDTILREVSVCLLVVHDATTNPVNHQPPAAGNQEGCHNPEKWRWLIVSIKIGV
jgi:hypothetical protein